MLEIGALVFLLMMVTAAVVVLACLAFVVRAVVWLVLLPIKLLFWFLFLPFLLLKLILGAILGIVLAPVFAVFGLLVAFTAGIALLIPMAPLLVIVAAIFWLIKKDRPTTTLPARTV
ncbi:MAG TPA: hypothetical protein VHI98_20630 [Vicinamibacterales bacterium]|jgi:hypothetical protein|nr:hypothetical protein [Vicinamibacterales bacterium]